MVTHSVCNPETNIIHCDQLTKVYKKYWPVRRFLCALKNVSLSVQAGRIVGLIGPNGAGKTTLLNLIAGLTTPTKGSVTVCGCRAKSKKAHAGLGYMPETPALLGRYSARDVLKYHGGLLGLSWRENRREVGRVLQTVELERDAHRACAGFSLGMKQRLSLGIAIMNKPRVLLLDEPSNGLDPIGIIQLRELLKQWSESGTTIIISSHRLDELTKVTSNFVFLHHGQTVSIEEDANENLRRKLFVGVISNGRNIAQQISSEYDIADASDSEIIVDVDSQDIVPDVIGKLVNIGARITHVIPNKEGIEDTFVRLHNERE
jgi:ABC-type multidrug transport system ATPase subunit